MDIFILFSALITLVALVSYINVKLLKLPTGIILMLMGMVMSAGVIIAGGASPYFTERIKEQLSRIDFSEFLLGIVLSFLLFAGSLHIDYPQLKKSGKSILIFSTIGTLLSTFLIGTIVYYLFAFFKLDIPFIACLLFGALISPTDPVVVLNILKQAKISKSIEIKITGESLFNDGIGVVIFITILEIVRNGMQNVSALSVITLLGQQAFGGMLVGLGIGYIGYKLMRSINHFQTEVFISLAMVMGGYSLCNVLHVSGPLAMVVAGIFIGNKSRSESLTDTNYLKNFWEVTDEILNALLFLLIGLELVVVSFDFKYLFLGLLIALLLIIVRYISLWIPSQVFRLKKTLENKALEIMTWGGLRGGISIALALSLPADNYKSIFVSITFAIVLFSIIVQGLTIGRFVKWLGQSDME